MFYVKTQLTEETAITTDITDENVFTRCFNCGSEFAVDIVDLLYGGDVDLYGTNLLCDDCAKKPHDEIDWPTV